jgi:Domain of unknown function (DUF4173)
MRLTTLLVGIVAYQILFFQEKLGLNTLVFALFALFLLWKTKSRGAPLWSPNEALWSPKQLTKQPETLLTAATFLVLSGAIVLHNSLFSKIMWWIVLFVAIGLAQMPTIRLTFNALWHGFVATLLAPIAAYRSSGDLTWGNTTKLTKSLRWLRYGGIALFVFPLFFGLYYAANTDFAYLVDKSFATIGDILSAFSFEISFERICSVLFAFGLMSAILLPMLDLNLAEAEQTDTLSRITAAARLLARNALHYKPMIWYNATSLLNEYRMGVVLLAMLNGLLLLINLLDIRGVWLGIGADIIPKTGEQLIENVHNSTYVLILSIILATSVVGYFFRNNLNFYTKNQKIMLLSKVWLFQNMFLAITLFIHNMHYISALGFAYKRLGILAFLILVVFGLYSVFIKIKTQRSMYYLFRVNSWAVLLVLSLCAIFDWDNIITNYNFAQMPKNEALDFKFLINGMNSNKNIPTLWAYRERMTTLQKGDLSFVLQQYRRENPAKAYGFWSYNYNDVCLDAFYKQNLAAIDVFCEQYKGISPYEVYN